MNKRNTVLIILLILIIAVIILISRGKAHDSTPKTNTCITDADCSNGEVCQNGACVLVPPEPEPQVSCDCEFGAPQEVIETNGATILKGYDGLIYTVVTTMDPGPIYTNYIGRHLKDGTLDTTFGTAGYLTIQTPLPSMLQVEILPLDDGAFACQNESGSRRLWRILSDGSIDPGFPVVTIASISGGSIYDDPERKLLPGTNGGFFYCQDEHGTPYNQHFFKYTPTGLDVSYGTFAGRATFSLHLLLAGINDFSDMRIVKSLSDGSLIIFHTAERTPNVYRPAVTKLTPTGAIDTSFGVNGHFWDTNEVIARGPFSPWGDVGSDGSIYYIGTGCTDLACASESTVALKLTSTGELDTTWGVDGYFAYDATPPYTGAASIAVEPCGGVMIAYWAEMGPVDDIHIVRLDSSGNLNPLYPVVITGQTPEFDVTVVSGGEFFGDPIYYHFVTRLGGPILTMNCV